MYGDTTRLLAVLETLRVHLLEDAEDQEEPVQPMPLSALLDRSRNLREQSNALSDEGRRLRAVRDPFRNDRARGS